MLGQYRRLTQKFGVFGWIPALQLLHCMKLKSTLLCPTAYTVMTIFSNHQHFAVCYRSYMLSLFYKPVPMVSMLTWALEGVWTGLDCEKYKGLTQWVKPACCHWLMKEAFIKSLSPVEAKAIAVVIFGSMKVMKSFWCKLNVRVCALSGTFKYSGHPEIRTCLYVQCSTICIVYFLKSGHVIRTLWYVCSDAIQNALWNQDISLINRYMFCWWKVATFRESSIIAIVYI